MSLLQKGIRTQRVDIEHRKTGAEEPQKEVLPIGCSGLHCLQDYVQAPDPAYSWSDTGRRLHGQSLGQNWTGAVLSLISLAWQPAPGAPLQEWSHSLVVLRPDGSPASSAGWGVMYVAMGFFGGEVPHEYAFTQSPEQLKETEPDLVFAAELAILTQLPVAVLYDVPAEGLAYSNKTNDIRIEDSEVASGWARYAGIPPGGKLQPQYLVELPMVKAATRALDTVQAFLPMEDPALQVEHFVMVGSSKRGNLLWNLAPIESRVGAIVPVARTLNMDRFLRYIPECWGGFPSAGWDYWYHHIFSNVIGTQEATDIWNIIDGFAYLSKYKGLPKFVIGASSDEFFMPDYTRLFWDVLPEPKLNLMVPNSGHIVTGADFMPFVPTISAFINSVVLSYSPPELTWTVDPGTGAITAKVSGQSPAPSKVELWKAVTCTGQRRDFRKHNLDTGEACAMCGVQIAQAITPLTALHGTCENKAVWWTGKETFETSPGSRTWVASEEAPEDGRWVAFYLLFQFPPPGTPGAPPFTLSTEVSIFPTRLPFKSCDGPECGALKLVLAQQ